MQLPRRLLSLATLVLTARAIHESDVGLVDWHTRLVGVPLHATQLTKPVFHHDVVLTATGNNVLAALNATDGSIVWRSIHDPQDAIMGFKAHAESVFALSGPSGSTLRVYDVSTGHLVHERRLHNPAEGKKHDPPTLGIGLTLDRDHAIVLTNGDTVQRIHSGTGETAWQWRSEDQGSLVMYTHIHPDIHSSTLYVVGFAKSVRSYTLHVTTLDLMTGEVLASVNIPANITNALTDFLILSPSRSGSSSPTSLDDFGPSLVWLSPSSTEPKSPLSLFSAPLSPSLKGKVLTIPNASYKRIQDVDLLGKGLFLAFQENGTADVMFYESGGSPVRAVWDFGDVTPSPSTTGSHFVGALNEEGKAHVGRVAWSNIHNQAIHQTFEVNLDEGTGKTTGFAFPFETKEHGTIRHIAFSPSLVSASTDETVHKLLLVTSTGSLQLWHHSVLQWVREESLATVQTATIIELPPAKEVMEGGGKSEGFRAKISRQIGDIKYLPQYLIHFVTRFLTGSYSSPASLISLTSPSSNSSIPHLIPDRSPGLPASLVRDPFSFRQLLITTTTHGKLFALDTSTGAIIWSRILGLGWANKVGGRIVPVRSFVVRRPEAGAEDGSGIALVTQRVADNTLVDTVIFHFDPLTGEDIKIGTPSDNEAEGPRGDVKDANDKWINPLEGVDVIAGPLIDVFLMPDGKDTIGMLDEFLQVQLYPDTTDSRTSLTSLAPQIHLALRAGNQVLGHQLGVNEELSFFHVAFPTWGVSFGGDEEVVSILKNSFKGREVASVGRVKGDRSTLYKYLNPHLSVVISAPSHEFSLSSVSSHLCGLHVVDVVKGTVLYHVSLPLVNGKCDIKAVLDENWLVYSYYDDGIEDGSAKGHRVVSVEMYEGYGPDEKISSSDITSYSNKTTQFSVYEQTFAIQHAVTALATTTTKFGVSTKDVIISSRRNSVHSIPRRLLNPRRPNRKPTSEEAEEMLIQYDPVLPDDGRLVLSHYYEVADVRQIITAPSILESTTLVLAVGTDLFLTRVATSGTFDVLSENFNKVQLVLTVVGLAVAIAVTRPMVRRKKLRERWYQ